jgi:hypothetical protein
MEEAKNSAPYLGVYVSERILSTFFDHMERMPVNNPKYDYICGKGFKIDIKSSCRRYQGTAYSWNFAINHNIVADYFLCLAFDNRESLNPEHVWLIPSTVLGDRVSVGIHNGKLDKWARFERALDRVMSCCNKMKIVVGTEIQCP